MSRSFTDRNDPWAGSEEGNEVHHDLAWKDDVLVPPLALHVVERDVVVVGDLAWMRSTLRGFLVLGDGASG
jgi:hypothetical protein